MRPTAFLVDGIAAVDAGALTTALDLEAQARVGHVFLSHSHIDHLGTLPFLLDNVFHLLRRPIVIHGPDHTIRCLREDLFNGRLWPDFTAFANTRSSILELEVMAPGDTVTLGGLRFTATAMDHTVPCHGYLVEDDRDGVFIAGDTRSLDGALPLLRSSRTLRAVILEASFPERMASLARASRHLTTEGFAREARKVPEGTSLHATHMKPECLEEIRHELKARAPEGTVLLEQGRPLIPGLEKGTR